AEKAAVNVAFLKGPTGMGAAKLMADADAGTTQNAYSFTLVGAADVVTGQLVSGELDMAALPTNAIAALYQKTEGGVQALAVNTLGVLYVLERGESVQALSDLDGKTILSSGQGSTAEAVLNYLLAAAGVTANVEYVSEHSEVVAKATAENSEYDVVLLPEPFVTMMGMQAPDFRVALNLTEEWNRQGAGLLPMGGIAVRREFAEENPEAVAAFLEEYAASVEWVNANAEEAATLIEQYDIMKAAVAKNAIPRANMVCLTGDAMRMVLENFYGALEGFNVKLIGGAAPGEDFYYGASGEGASVAVIGGADGPTAIYVAPTESGK
ncbi:MAG: ABC transporter substrate-binding protein, partial [Clostridiales bacterium]|nr:ABC transporter substrate-binding protein [Clostridiales bacterium]